MRESGGGTIAVTEMQIVAALRRLARAGLFAVSTSALAAAAAWKARRFRQDKAGESTVALLTGSGLKAAVTVAEATAGKVSD